ncbi:adenosylcobinamide-GDP ribazoletransferase [Rossellomorea vietnamensis]|uniref:Adenosylcobinamide-GDP ribazoletransferase n=1 Tax=Rossellomorea vietnamensis TaxID=218284 RepID=A0ACD4C8T6_9BACI|nr:adenosylcobinamide-GDP ribazoletransferase [Rossellomorea vietnamensis]UXH44903.1 adenosylcobinamide-GDP ribazoletransferase [Rossellomorea vietnamensis]
MRLVKSLLLNLQFFTVLPVRKEFSLGKSEMRWMVRTFPILGLLIGMFLSSGYVLLASFTPMSSLALSFYIWVMPILLTGGIHLDGYMDASDAYFSYRDLKKRLEIMKDPRIGAFGALSLVVLLSSRFLFIYESVHYSNTAVICLILLSIPIFSRILMGVSLILIPAAHNSGMGYSFSKDTKWNDVLWMLASLIGIIVTGVFLNSLFLYAAFTIVTVGFCLFVYSKSIKWFGGMTGDTVGASVEGVESILWMTIWLLLSFDMV